MPYTIGEMAKQLDLASSTLRYYDKEGLLPFVERTDGGIRSFKEDDVAWLKTIECLKKTGISIKDIKQFIDWCIEGDSTIDKRLELIKKQKDEVNSQIEKLKGTLDMLDYKQWYYEKANAAGTCAVHTSMKQSEIPEKFLKYRKKSD